MNAPHEPARRHAVHRFFLRGLITLLPVVVTAFILVAAYRFVAGYVTGPVNSVIYWSLEHNALGWRALGATGLDPYSVDYLEPSALPLELQELLRERGYSDPEFQAQLARYRAAQESFFRDFDDLAIQRARLRRDVTARVPRLVGLVVSILLVLSLGSLAGGFLGRKVLEGIDRTLYAIPVVRSVYPYSKQFVDFLLGQRKLAFDTVVAVPYPSPGLWSTGFVTGRSLRSLRERTGENLVTVFMPSSPMPMSGYTIFIAAERLIPLPFTVDEALRIIVSGGVLVPPAELVEGSPTQALGSAIAERGGGPG
ncbi:MAG TPA: DUF502 domain-containing protein [Planctomycetota bacterium]|nr:DUF502 domain-containing protein [Planctomycetota bacterium]